MNCEIEGQNSLSYYLPTRHKHDADARLWKYILRVFLLKKLLHMLDLHKTMHNFIQNIYEMSNVR